MSLFLIIFDQKGDGLPRSTLKMVAELAGVGSATAERVLNGRGGVKPKLVEAVLAAARKLDYPKRLPELHRGVTRIEVLMARPDLTFVSRLSQSFERISASLDSSIAVHRTFINETNPSDMAARILKPSLRRSALIVALPHHPLVAEALKEAERSGEIVIQVMTHLDGVQAPFVGIDNKAAGRMAGLLMAGMQRESGSVIALCHSQIYGVQRDRLAGFSNFMEKPQARHLDFQMAIFTHDDAEEAAKTVTAMLRRAEPLAGIYSAGGDYGPLCDALKRSGQAGRVCLIGHELTEQSAKALKDGTMAAVIDQAPETQARRALDIALLKLGMLHTKVDVSPIRFVTVTAENI